VGHVFQRAPEASTRLRVRTGLEECNSPILLVMGCVITDLGVATKLQCDVTRIPEEIAKVISYHFPFVAQAKNKLLVARLCVKFQQTPKNWAATHRHHPLGTKLRLLPEPSPEPPAKNNNFHQRIQDLTEPAVLASSLRKISLPTRFCRTIRSRGASKSRST